MIFWDGRGAVTAAALSTALWAPGWWPGGGATPGGAPPRLPAVQVDTTYPTSPGSTWLVREGEDLQAVLDAAEPGDAIVLDAGAVFVGAFTLPAKSGDGWIVVRTSAEAALPPPGRRVGPAHALLMPKLLGSRGTVLEAMPGAHHYRFVGIEIAPTPGTFLHNLVILGSVESSRADQPHHVVFDRCYLHGDSVAGTRRGIALNGGHMAVVDSRLTDFKMVGEDSQAIAGWNGAGPFALVNNTFEAAGENVMFGGGDPAVSGLVPSDIEVRWNHFAKPLSWKQGEPDFEGTPWTVKNLFELKNARRVLVEGNVFERNWIAGQGGFAVLFTVRNQDGTAPWSVVEDVTFRSNVVRHVAAGINVLGRDAQPSRRTRRVLIANNLFVDVGGPRWGGGTSAFAMLLDGTVDVVLDHNTALQVGPILVADGDAHHAFVYRNNVAPHNDYGIIGTGTAPGHHTLAEYFPGAKVVQNVIAGGHPLLYPDRNFFPASLEEVGFVNLVEGDLRLAPSSPFAGAATDGKDVGVVFDELLAALGPEADAGSPALGLGGL